MGPRKEGDIWAHLRLRSSKDLGMAPSGVGSSSDTLGREPIQEKVRGKVTLEKD